MVFSFVALKCYPWWMLSLFHYTSNK